MVLYPGEAPFICWLAGANVGNGIMLAPQKWLITFADRWHARRRNWSRSWDGKKFRVGIYERSSASASRPRFPALVTI